MPRGIDDIHIPTDLLGLTLGTYDPQRQDKNFIAALGTACHQIRLDIKKSSNEKTNPITTQKEVNTAQIIEEDDFFDSTNKLPTLNNSTTAFFDEKMCDAFPGKRGLNLIEDPEIAINRLELLLKQPIIFRDKRPIWWFRGSSSTNIENFKRISSTKCLLNHKEIVIDKLYYYRDDARYYQDFVYILTKPEQQIGINNFTNEAIKKYIQKSGYFNEEYALLNDIPISRAEYDDGSAEINGKIVNASDAKLRVRFLSPYNFVITAQHSPINSGKYDKKIEELFSGLLNGTKNIENLLDFIQFLPRHRYEKE